MGEIEDELQSKKKKEEKSKKRETNDTYDKVTRVVFRPGGCERKPTTSQTSECPL